MKKKLISLFVTSCHCLSLVGWFFVSWWNEYHMKHINKKIQKVKILSHDKKTKGKTTQGIKSNKKVFSYTSEKKNWLNVFKNEPFSFIWEEAHQYFYGKSFYFMLFWVIKNLN